MRFAILWVLLFLGLTSACVLDACAAPSSGEEASSLSPEGRYQRYAEKVALIDRSAGAVFSAFDYAALESFQQLADSNTKDPDLCVRFLTISGHTSRQRLIAILSMYKLSISQYVEYVRKLVGLRDDGLVSSDELVKGLFPRLSDIVFENYQDDSVRSLLKAVEIRGDVRPEIKSTIRDVLSGEATAKRKSFDRECCSTGK